MRRVAVLAMAVLLAACGHTHAASHPNEVDHWFVATMVPHHRLGVELLEIAQPRVHDVRVRRLVFEMGGYHHDELHHLEHRLQQWGLSEALDYPGRLPVTLLDELRATVGPDHDVAWLVAMIEHHEGAVMIAERQVNEGTDAELQQLARTVAEVQRSEIAAMKALVRSISD